MKREAFHRDDIPAANIVVDASEPLRRNWILLPEVLAAAWKRIEKLEENISVHQSDLYELRGLKGIMEGMIAQVNKLEMKDVRYK